MSTLREQPARIPEKASSGSEMAPPSSAPPSPEAEAEAEEEVSRRTLHLRTYMPGCQGCSGSIAS
eukprot:9166991-Pyramimonas_sp.AAC.1